MLYDWLKENFHENEPILIEEIVAGAASGEISEVEVRHELKKLSAMGLVCRYDAGMYFLPPEGLTRAVVRPPRNLFAEKKFLLDDGQPCGYISGRAFASELGLVKRPVSVTDIVTNKERRAHRETSIAGQLYLLRRPVVLVNAENREMLQLLDLIRDLDEVSDLEPAEAAEKVRAYIERNDVAFSDAAPYLDFYPDRIWKNLYRCGMLTGRMPANRDPREEKGSVT